LVEIEYARQILGLRDIILGPIVLCLLYIWGLKIFKRHSVFGNKEDIKLFKVTFFLKAFSAVASALIFQYYYKYGDTFGYYDGGEMLVNAFTNDLSAAADILFSEQEDFSYEALQYIGHFQKSAESTFFIMKLSGLLMLPFFKSYIAVSFVISFLALLGTWKIYEFFIYYYPELKRTLKYTVLLCPTMMFWGTGLLKDPICIACMGAILINLFNMLVKRNVSLFSIFSTLILSYILIKVKSYIFVATVGGFALFYFLQLFSQTLSSGKKFLLIVLFFGAVAIGSLAISNILAEQFDFINNTDQALDYIDTMHRSQEMSSEGSGGSGYKLPDLVLSPIGILNIFFVSVNVACFRPYIWETTKPIIFLDTLQSLFAFFALLYAFFKAKLFGFYLTSLFNPFKLVKHAIKSPVIIMSIFVIMVIGFLSGFLSYNFGTLSRYRIPMLPFLFSLPFLILCNYRREQAKATSIENDSSTQATNS
jgi:hypothetical protein